MRGRPAATATMRASMNLRWPSTVAAAHVALDLDLGRIGAGGQRALGDRGAHPALGIGEGCRLVGEILDRLARRHAEQPFPGLADHRLGADTRTWPTTAPSALATSVCSGTMQRLPTSGGSPS